MTIYAVKVGRKPGVYQTWQECKQETSAFSKADFKSFKTIEEAQKYLEGGVQQTLSTETKKNRKTQCDSRFSERKRQLQTGKSNDSDEE